MQPQLITLFAYLNEAGNLLRTLDAIMARDGTVPDPNQLQQARRVFGRLPNTVLNLQQSLRARPLPRAFLAEDPEHLSTETAKRLADPEDFTAVPESQ